MTIWRTLRRWSDEFWFEIAMGLTLLFVVAFVVLLLVVILGTV